MSFPIIMAGDVNIAGGASTPTQFFVTINGRPIQVTGAPVLPHPAEEIIHAGITISSTTLVYINGQGVGRAIVDVDSCGHPRLISSQSFVFVLN